MDWACSQEVGNDTRFSCSSQNQLLRVDYCRHERKHHYICGSRKVIIFEWTLENVIEQVNTSTRHVYRDSLSGICSRVYNPYPPFHSAFENYIPNPRNIVSTDCGLQFITSPVFLEQRIFIPTPTFLLFSVQLCILHLSDNKKFICWLFSGIPQCFTSFPLFLYVAP